MSERPDIHLPVSKDLPAVLALGGFLKVTVSCLAQGRITVSPDVGNLDSPQAIAAFEETVTRLLAECGGAVSAITHDLHPDFYSTRYAVDLGRMLGVPVVAVQHHAAHMGAILAERDWQSGTVTGLALDGFGLGPDQASWGGELIAVDPTNGHWTRLGGLAPLLQPGGDRAAREPWRMAAAALHRIGRTDDLMVRYGDLAGGEAGITMLSHMMSKALNSPPTSSCGRLFDAACGLLGVVPRATFEGEAPIALEKMVDHPEVLSDGWRVTEDGTLSLDPLLCALADLGAGKGWSVLDDDVRRYGANLFHGTLAAALIDWVQTRVPGRTAVPLGGGCFFNRVLSSLVSDGLTRAGYSPLAAQRLSPGDPAISAGQAWLVSRQISAR